ncbi:hypothetical protein BBP40_000598 [Aspergillus hancockii]|nr:hypothetical protein BBP40_000598 [Aspergillus hancockii]
MSHFLTARPRGCHLSTIIDLYPEEEYWCAGYAPSKGRQCHRRIHERNRRSARTLLDDATARFHDGLSIDDLLEKLAPLVLCKTNHQDQASGLAATWRRRICNFRAGQTTQQASRDAAFLEEQYTSALIRTIEQAIEDLRRVQTQDDELTSPTSRRREHRVSPTISTTGATTSATTSNTPSTTSARSQRSTETTASSPATNGPPRQVTPTVEVEPGSNPLPNIAEPSMPAATRSVRSTRPLATRKCVEGNCGICILPLREEEPLGSGGDGSDDGTTDDDGIVNAHIASRVSQDNDELKELVWCKSQCGSNYHKSCIDQWVTACGTRSATCPTCRAVWRS